MIRLKYIREGCTYCTVPHYDIYSSDESDPTIGLWLGCAVVNKEGKEILKLGVEQYNAIKKGE